MMQEPSVLAFATVKRVQNLSSVTTRCFTNRSRMGFARLSKSATVPIGRAISISHSPAMRPGRWRCSSQPASVCQALYRLDGARPWRRLMKRLFTLGGTGIVRMIGSLIGACPSMVCACPAVECFLQRRLKVALCGTQRLERAVQYWLRQFLAFVARAGPNPPGRILRRAGLIGHFSEVDWVF